MSKRRWYSTRGPWWLQLITATGGVLVALSVLVFTDHVTAGRVVIGVLAIGVAVMQLMMAALQWRDLRSSAAAPPPGE
jgi:uncharacterized membrane protein YidH (DUF202 family)